MATDLLTGIYYAPYLRQKPLGQSPDSTFPMLHVQAVFTAGDDNRHRTTCRNTLKTFIDIIRFDNLRPISAAIRVASENNAGREPYRLTSTPGHCHWHPDAATRHQSVE